MNDDPPMIVTTRRTVLHKLRMPFIQIQEQYVKSDEVKNALSRIDGIFAQLKPFERQDSVPSEWSKFVGNNNQKM